MKTTLKKMQWLIAILLVALLATFSCDDANEEGVPTVPAPNDLMPALRFALPESCSSSNLTTDSVYLINSQEEFSQHFACWENVASGINLDIHSLIVVQPLGFNSDSRIEEFLWKRTEENKYLLSINVIHGIPAHATPLIISFLIPKIQDASSIQLLINGKSIDTGTGWTVGSEKMLLGAWQEVYPNATGSLVTFSGNDTIYQQIASDNSILKMTYNVIAEDTIQIERLWISDIGAYERKNNSRFLLYGNDSLSIYEFSINEEIGYPVFDEIKLVRRK